MADTTITYPTQDADGNVDDVNVINKPEVSVPDGVDVNNFPATQDVDIVAQSLSPLVVSGTVTATPSGTQNVDITGQTVGDLDVNVTNATLDVSGSTVTINEPAASRGPFSRQRVANPVTLHDAQFTYNLQPLLYEQLTNGGGGIAYDSTEGCAGLSLTTATPGDYAHMKTYEHFRYQPGNGQLIFITFNFQSASSDFTKFAGYGHGSNGIYLEQNGATTQFVIYSSTSHGNEIVTQASWSEDTLDGNGPSGITLDLTKSQILVIDFQALYVGRVRVGFDIDGEIVYAHEFVHANQDAYPYIRTANLPIHVGVTADGGAPTTSMLFFCATVKSEGGDLETQGYTTGREGDTNAAGNGAWEHILSVRPKTTFNSLTNRSKFVLESVEIAVRGTSSIKWALVLGQGITGTTTFTDVNATYSAFEYNEVGTISGSASIVVMKGAVAASNQAKATASSRIPMKYPITLDSAGAVRSLGTLSLIAWGYGGASAVTAVLNWKEIR